MEPINYEQAVLCFTNNPLQIPTLGRISSIDVDVVGNQIRITNARGNSEIIDIFHWNALIERINELDENEKEMTSRYAHGNHPYNWNNSPNRIFSPYVPAIIRYLNENQ